LASTLAHTRVLPRTFASGIASGDATWCCIQGHGASMSAMARIGAGVRGGPDVVTHPEENPDYVSGIESNSQSEALADGLRHNFTWVTSPGRSVSAVSAQVTESQPAVNTDSPKTSTMVTEMRIAPTGLVSWSKNNGSVYYVRVFIASVRAELEPAGVQYSWCGASPPRDAPPWLLRS